MMKSLDDNIGRVLARLAELGFDRDTIVVFTSDNGGERFSDTWPFTGKKTELLEGGLRIPAIVRWPGVVAAGQPERRCRSSRWTGCRRSSPPAAGGRARPSRATASTSGRRSPAARCPSARCSGATATSSSARRGAASYKYLKINDNEFLFDVVADPLERANLKLRQPELFAELKAAWEQWDAGMLHDPTALERRQHARQPRRPLQLAAASAAARAD